MSYILYVLHCSDDSLYVGITNDLENRLLVHANGKGSKYVRSRLPFEVAYTETLADKSTALKRELEIKSWSRTEKFARLKINVGPWPHA